MIALKVQCLCCLVFRIVVLVIFLFVVHVVCKMCKSFRKKIWPKMVPEILKSNNLKVFPGPLKSI